MSDEIVATWVCDEDGEGLMILAHPSGCVEVLGCELRDFQELACAELEAYYLGFAELTHQACEFACVDDHSAVPAQPPGEAV